MNALNTALQSTQTTVQETLLSLPQQLKAQLPLSTPLKLQIAEQRQTIQNILDGKDHRLMVITGPCSIHDPIAVLEYAEKLKQLQTKVSDQIFFVIRAYIENHGQQWVGKVFIRSSARWIFQYAVGTRAVSSIVFSDY